MQTALLSTIVPGHPEYEEARRIFYSGLDRHPAAIYRPRDEGEVARVIAAARDTGLPLAVRSGGHSVSGHGVAEGGIVLDLKEMRSITVDPVAREARVGAGATAREYTTAAGAHGLATGFGDSGGVGIGGITLSGGVGFLHRKLGLTIDSLIGATLATAGGEILEVDEANHPDLFWAIRGGGGNFGVVTRFRFRLHEVDAVTAGVIMIPATAARIASILDYLTAAPDELAGIASVMLAPPMPMIPAEFHGKPLVVAILVHLGDGSAIAPLRKLATPVVDSVGPARYREIYEGPEPPRRPFIATHPIFTDRVDEAAGEAVLEALQRSRAPMKVVQFRALGGAVARVAGDATAFAHRNRALMAIPAALFDEAGEVAEHAAWSESLADEIRRGEPGAYAAFLADHARIGDAYPATTHERLRRVKRAYDPHNLFRLNLNIVP